MGEMNQAHAATIDGAKFMAVDPSRVDALARSNLRAPLSGATLAVKSDNKDRTHGRAG
jgi:hypothetical protein